MANVTLIWVYRIRVSQKFCTILVTYLLYFSSYNKNSLKFKVEAIVLHCLKPPFCQFFDSMLITILDFPGKEFFSLKLLPPLRCWIIASAGSEPWIGKSNDPKEISWWYTGWNHLSVSSLISYWRQFLSFGAKNSFTEASERVIIWSN